MVRLNWSWSKKRWSQVPERRCVTPGCRFQAVPGLLYCIRHTPKPSPPSARPQEQLSLF